MRVMGAIVPSLLLDGVVDWASCVEEVAGLLGVERFWVRGLVGLVLASDDL